MNRERSTVLITGSTGLIGKRLVGKLAPEYNIISVDRDTPSTSNGHSDFIDFVEADLSDDADTHRALELVKQSCGRELAGVVHLAAYYDFAGEPSPLYEELNVRGTRRLLQGLQDFHVEQFVFSSTLLVMEPDEKHRSVSELSPKAAQWDYPRSKLRAEQAIEKEHGSIPYVILRIAGVYDDDCHSIPIAHHIQRIYEKRFESYVFPGDPDSGQAFVHLDDLVEGIATVIAHRKRLNKAEVFLLGEPDVVTYGEMQELLGQYIHGEKWPTVRIPKVIAKAGAWVQQKLSSEHEKPFIKPWMIDFADQHYQVNISHARATLGWDPQRRLRTALAEMVRRLHENPRRWYEENDLEYPEDVD